VIILCKKRLFFAKRRLFFAKKIILCKKKIILHKKEDYSLQKRLFFAKKKIILCKRNRFGPDVPLKMGFDLEFIRFMFFTCLSFVCLSQFTNKQTFVVNKQTNICCLFVFLRQMQQIFVSCFCIRPIFGLCRPVHRKLW